MAADKEIINMLIDEYDRLTRIRKLAEKEGAAEAVKEIDRAIHFIKLKLHPLELSEQ